MFEAPEKAFDLVAFEHEVLEFWERVGAFETLRRKNAGRRPWSFLDGPITANNPMGVHHAWGRTLKDCYQRFHAMLGRDQRYQNGFDCQGLWVEVEVEKELGFKSKRDIEEYGLEKFVDRCKQRVREYSELQTRQSIRLGMWMDWDDSYFTMSDENNYTIWTFLRKCHDRGLIYKGLDAMPWCPRCEVGISEQEQKEGYQEIEDVAVFLRMPLLDREHEHLLVWTTTPWTLAANVACAVNPELTYIRARQDGEVYILSRELESILKGKGAYEVLEAVSGESLLGLRYRGPFDDISRPGSAAGAHTVIAWKEIAATEGTGIVHIAPGCGKEDFRLGRELNLPVIEPIDAAGRFREGFGFLTGKQASDVAEEVLEHLRGRGVYYRRETYAHNYPHCWRCSTKLLFRAVDEWYIRMDWREEIKEVARPIEWIPEYGLGQELDWLDNMGDWMISKKRYWGLALPIYECEACGHFDVVGSKQELKERAIQGWEEFEGNSPHRPWVDAVKIECGGCGGPVSRIPDVGNPWLDAGIVPYSTVHYNTDRDAWAKWIPADLVLESFPGQFRNWFYALLAMSTMMENQPPFKTLVGYALVRDEHGEEMHKSKGNAIWFDDAAEKMGVDSMRWLYCRQNPTLNVNFGYGVTDQIRRKVFATLWNVYTFFVGYARADAYDPARKKVPAAERQDIDRWLLSKLQQLVQTGRKSLAAFDAPTLVRRAEEFIDGLSTWYVRRCRRRFWRPKSRDDRDKLAAYQTLHETLATLTKVLAPVVPMLTEKLYRNLVRSVDAGAPESVHHCDYPEPDEALLDEALAADMDTAHRVVSTALRVRESESLRVRQPLAEMRVVAPERERAAVARFEDHILDELNIKALHVEESLTAVAEAAVKPNTRLLGPKYGQDLPRIQEALEARDALEIASSVQGGEPIDLGEWRLRPDEVLVETHYATHLAAGEDRGITVLLDVNITPELEREGLARDVVRHIQTARKTLDLDLADRIRVGYETGDDLLARSIAEHAGYIRRETLCDRLEQGKAGGAAEIRLGGRTLRLAVERT